MIGWSCFSGVGGLDLGLHRAGVRIVLQCEQNRWRRHVLSQHFGCNTLLSDVRDVRADSAERPDIVFGGFPCQDLSIAGDRKGLAGERSGLFFEFARILDDVKPEWCLIENVPGLFSSQGGGDFGVVLETLADLGYGVAWRVLNSRFFGVPQRRRRVFILGAYVAGDPRTAAERAGAVLSLGESCPRHSQTSEGSRADDSTASISGLGDGGPDDNDAQAGRLIVLDEDGEAVAAGYEDDTAVAFAQNQRGELRESPIAPQLTCGGGKPGEGCSAMRIGDRVRRLTPLECERLQAFPDDWTVSGSDTKRYAGIGDAVTVTVPEWIGARLVNEPDNWREIVAARIVQRDLDALPPEMPDVPEQMELVA